MKVRFDAHTGLSHILCGHDLRLRRAWREGDDFAAGVRGGFGAALGVFHEGAEVAAVAGEEGFAGPVDFIDDGVVDHGRPPSVVWFRAGAGSSYAAEAAFLKSRELIWDVARITSLPSSAVQKERALPSREGERNSG